MCHAPLLDKLTQLIYCLLILHAEGSDGASILEFCDAGYWEDEGEAMGDIFAQ